MKKSNYFSSRAFRKGTLSVVIIALVIVVVLLVNILATAFSQRYPFSLDLTANKDYTIELTETYEDFVSKIDKDINITVCAAKTDFENGTFANSMGQALYLAEYFQGNGPTEVTTKYARQVAKFLESFSVINRKISVTFVNPNSVTEISAITNQYPNETLEYGDVIVSCKHPTMEDPRYHIVKINQMFTLVQNDAVTAMLGGYAYAYDITGSALASEVVSSLLIVTSESSVNVAVLGGHNVVPEHITYLQTFLTKNNYTFTEVNDLLKEGIPEEAQMAILSAPMNDYTTDEITILEEFLNNGKQYGKTLVYIASIYQPELPRLEAFLAEWGIKVLPAYTVDEENTSLDGVKAQIADSIYTEGFDLVQQYFMPTIYRTLQTTFESQDQYVTTKILTSGEKGYGIGLDVTNVDEDVFENADYKGQLDYMVLSTYQYMESSSGVAGESNVLVVSGDGFFSQTALTSSAYLNSTLTLNLFNDLSGADDVPPVVIEDKVISTTSFLDKIANTSADVVIIVIFVGVIPVGLIVLSLVIWVKRKKK